MIKSWIKVLYPIDIFLVVDHLPLKKKLSSSGPGMVVLAQGNTGITIYFHLQDYFCIKFCAILMCN